ncbi:MAG: hypothetical protein MUP63_03060 [Candidatus Nanohaloarchaeota archaeon QJJ-7]|nr:hypothetical protein [Candidatus Nanohaloarchaeota archaeon QJJ-7]
MTLVESAIVFLVSLLLGAFGIHIGATLLLGESDYWNAIWTALIGAFVMAVVGFFLGGIPFFGPLLTLAAWVWVIHVQYRSSLGQSIAIGVAAWATVIIVLYLLALFGVTGFEAIGVPGV